MIPSNLDPTQFTALQSLDFGNILSPDGRAHPFDALTPISFTEVPATVIPPGTQTGPQVPAVSLPGDGSTGIDPSVAAGSTSVGLSTLGSELLPKHFGARAAVGVIAVAIIILVVVRFVL